MALTSQNYSALADDAYNDRVPTEQTPNQEPVTLNDVKYKVLEHRNNPITGFQGTVYLHENTGDIVVSIRGSEFGGKTRIDPADGVVDLQMAAKRANLQLHDAEQLTEWAVNKSKELEQNPINHGKHHRVSTTGHSLGGGLAEHNAHKYRLYGESFNAYGAHGLGMGVAKGGHFVAHVMAGDVVSAVSEHYGQVVTYAKPQEISIMQQSSTWVAAKSLLADSHAMSNFTGSDGQVSVLDHADAIRLAQMNQSIIEQYRNEIHTTKNLVVMGLNLNPLAVGTLFQEGKDFYNHVQQQKHTQPAQNVHYDQARDHYDRTDKLDNYKARARAEAQQPAAHAHEHNTHAIITHLEARHDKQLKQKAEANAEFEREAHRHNPNQGQNHSDTKEQPHQPYGGSPDKYSPQSQADTPLTATQARAESADPRFTANFNKILTEIRDDPEVMAHLDAKGLSAPQSLNSIAAYAAHQSFANGAHPIDGVVMMDDGQLTVVYQSPHKPYQDTYVFDMAQAATIDPKVSEQTANLALDNHTKEFAAVVAQYQIPGGMSHGMSLSSPSASGGDAGSVG